MCTILDPLKFRIKPPAQPSPRAGVAPRCRQQRIPVPLFRFRHQNNCISVNTGRRQRLRDVSPSKLLDERSARMLGVGCVMCLPTSGPTCVLIYICHFSSHVKHVRS